MNTLTDLLLGVGQPRVSHFPDLCTLLYTYLSTLDYWTKIVYYLFTQTSPVAHTSALIPTYIKSQKLPNWPISKELGLGRMLLPHWKLLFKLHSGECHKTSLLPCQHWLRQWLGAIRQQTITWANLDTALCCHMASLNPLGKFVCCWWGGSEKVNCVKFMKTLLVILFSP